MIATLSRSPCVRLVIIASCKTL